MDSLQTETFDSRQLLSRLKSMHERVIASKKAVGDENIIFPEYAVAENAENIAAKPRGKNSSREIN